VQISVPTTASREDDVDTYALRMWRELDDAYLRLRFHFPLVGLVVLEIQGDAKTAVALDHTLFDKREQWFAREVLAHMRRVLKRVEGSAKSLFTMVSPGACVAGALYDLALAGDRIYLREGGAVSLSPLNAGALTMANGLSRLHTRFLKDPSHAAALQQKLGTFEDEAAVEAGLVTLRVDDLDWDDDIRLAIEERASMSPDALTGTEANLRFCGPETMETKIFGRLSAWQNWIFQRDNAVGEKGALTLYGRPERPEFDWSRT
jgi:benzoyl-CoA-dihydrodiol lyase